MKTIVSRIFLIALASLLTACGDSHKDHAHKDHDHDHDHGGHVHTAPRGGTLVELGDHAANVELVLDAERKVFALYVLDAHAENAAKIEQSFIEIELSSQTPVTKDQANQKISIKLDAVANENTGEKVGDTSQFEVSTDKLNGAQSFSGVIKSITVKGATYTDVKFDFKPKES